MPATYEPIATQTLGSATSTITFSSIPSTWTDLKLVVVGTSSVDNVNFNMRFNGDSATNYSLTSLQGDGSNPSSGRSSNVAQIFMSYSGYRSTVPHMTTINIFSYAGSANKTCFITGSEDRNGAGSADVRAAVWRSYSPITSISVFTQSGNLNVGTTATLYGIKNA